MSGSSEGHWSTNDLAPAKSSSPYLSHLSKGQVLKKLLLLTDTREIESLRYKIGHFFNEFYIHETDLIAA